VHGKTALLSSGLLLLCSLYLISQATRYSWAVEARCLPDRGESVDHEFSMSSDRRCAADRCGSI
jgi:hypothetical protein